MCGPADMWEPLGLWEPADTCERWELPAGWCKHANTSSNISGEILVLKRQWISFDPMYPFSSSLKWSLLHKSQEYVKISGYRFPDHHIEVGWTDWPGGASGKSFGRKFKRRGCSPS